MIDLSMLDEQKLKELRQAHRKGFQAGVKGGKEPNCPYLPGSAEVIFWDRGLVDGAALRSERAANE